MTSVIQIKRSLTTNTPNTLSPGELAYSYSSNSLFIGDANSNVITLLTNVSVATISAQANAAYNQANAAYAQANAAYAEANLKLNTAGGTITGNLNVTHDLLISGNLTVTGNVTTINTVALLVDENVIYLSANTVGTPVLNNYITIGRGSSPNTFLIWDESIKKWGWTDDGSNVHYFADTYQLANAASNTANAAYAQANLAYGQANAAYAEANLKLNTSGGVITGDLTVSGNVSINSNLTIVGLFSATVDGGTF